MTTTVAICKSDLKRIANYLEDAAGLLSTQPSTSHRNKARLMTLMKRKIELKLNQYHNDKK